MSLVLDTSVTMAWYFEDESTAATEGVLDRVTETGAVVPTLWRLEVGNTLQMAIRRKRIDAAYRDAVLTELAAMPIAVDPATDVHAWTTALRLSERFDLTLYDAVFLELAQRRALPLATLDRELRAAGSRLGVELLGTTS